MLPSVDPCFDRAGVGAGSRAPPSDGGRDRSRPRSHGPAIARTEETSLIHLLAASLLWAFSFGLIKTQLAAYDPLAVALLRLALSAALFAPWLGRGGLGARDRWRAAGLGAAQFGAMYAFYIAAFGTLPAYAVAVLTTFTPLYVALLAGPLAGAGAAGAPASAPGRGRLRLLGAAALAVAGAAVVVWRGFGGGAWWSGALLVQASNLCFAAGQLGYRRLAGEPEAAGAAVAAGAPGLARAAGAPVPAAVWHAWMYLGGAALAGLLAAAGADRARLGFTPQALLAIGYLGLVPTAAGFFLWNVGAARVRAGPLAVANNLKIPLAVLVAWLVFGERADYLRVAVGLALILLALALAERNGGGQAPPRRARQRRDERERGAPASPDPL